MTPAARDGPAAPRGGRPQTIAELLGGFRQEFRPAARRKRSEIAAAWDTVCARSGIPGLADETHPAALQKGVLIVEVRATALLAQIQSFHHAALLALLLEAAPPGKVSGLRFRPGVF